MEKTELNIGVHHKDLVTWENQPLKLTGSKSLGDVGFLQFFRVVSGDYGKPWTCFNLVIVLLGLKRRFSRLNTRWSDPIDEPKLATRNAVFTSSKNSGFVVVNPGRIKGFDRGIRKIVDNISSGSVEEVLETIPPKSVYISCLLKNFVKKQDRVVNFRTKLKPTHLVAKHRRCELKTFLPTTSLTAYCWGIIENSFWLWIGKWSK